MGVVGQGGESWGVAERTRANVGRMEERVNEVIEDHFNYSNTKEEDLLMALFAIMLMIMVVHLIRERKNMDDQNVDSSDQSGEPDGFEAITDPNERERAEELLSGGDTIDLDLSEGDSATLPSGTRIKKTEDGFILDHK